MKRFFEGALQVNEEKGLDFQILFRIMQHFFQKAVPHAC
jgi:hypothetical protein